MIPALQTHQLSRQFGEMMAVDGIDLEVAQGEIYGFWVPTVPQSTMVRMLTTLLLPTSGTATVAGFDAR